MNISARFQMAIMAVQYMRRRKLRTLLTTLAIMFGVSLLFAVQLIIPSMMEAFDQASYTQTDGVDVTVMNTAGIAFDPAEPMRVLENVEGVAAVTGVLHRRISLPDEDRFIAYKIEVMGVDPATSPTVHQYDLQAGRFLTPDDEYAAVVSRGAAEVGQTLDILTVNGLSTFEVVGVLAHEAPDPLIPLVYAPITTMGELLNQPGLVTALDVALTPGSDSAAVEARINAALPDEYTTGGVVESMAAADFGYALLYSFGLIALFLGAFLIFNTFRTIVVERRRDMGMLRAIGAERGQIVQLLVIEGLLQGVVGTVIGLVIGYGLADVLVTWMQHSLDPNAAEGFRHVHIELSAGSILLASGVGLVTTLLAGLIPAWRAGQTSPLVALRPATTAHFKRVARWGLIVGIGVLIIAAGLLIVSDETAPIGSVVCLIGLLIIAPSLVIPAANLFEPILVLWFAREGDIARSNMVRQPGRAAITASTLMIGLAVVVQLAATMTGFDKMLDDLMDKSLAHDVLLTTESGGTYGHVVGADASLKEALRALPEVAVVSDWTYASSNAQGERLDIIGIDPVAFPLVTPLDFVAGDPDAAYADLTTGRTMIVNPSMAAVLNLAVGDTFDIQTAQGPLPYRVVGVANDFFNFRAATLWMSQDNLAADFNKTDSIMFMINLTPEADQVVALERIRAAAADYPQFTVELTSVYRDELSADLSGTNMMNWGLAVLIMGPAALGLINTLAINILERTREIGVVRAIGASRDQMQRIVIAEALLLGLFGASLGVIAGVAMSYGFTLALGTIGWEVQYYFPAMGVVSAVIVALLLSLFASILPARHAAQLDIIRALQYE